MPRKLSDSERAAIVSLSKNLAPSIRIQLLSDLENSMVCVKTSDGSRLEFVINEYVRPDYRGQHDYGVAGKVLDADGQEMEVALYADENDRLLELEIIKWGDCPIVSPDWNAFTVLY